MANLFVGVDVSKQTLDLFVSGHDCVHQFDNSESGLDKLIAFLVPLAVTLVACEASGGYENKLISRLLMAKIPVARANAERVRHFARSMGILAKTDAIDARIIARYASVAELRVLSLPSPARLSLREHYQCRSQLQQSYQSLHMSSRGFDKKSPAGQAARHVLEELQRQIKVMDVAIKTIVEQDLELAEKAKILTTMKGIGVLTAASLLSQLPELGEANDKEIAALVGLAPYAKESGSLVSRRRCRGGRKEVRTALFLASVSATRFNPVLKSFHRSLIERGKPKKVARVACMRKMLVWLNAMLRDGVPFSLERAQGLT